MKRLGIWLDSDGLYEEFQRGMMGVLVGMLIRKRHKIRCVAGAEEDNSFVLILWINIIQKHNGAK